MVYAHVKSFTIVKNRKCGQVTSHCRKARPYRADLSLFLNVPVVTVKSEITVWGILSLVVLNRWWVKAFDSEWYKHLCSGICWLCKVPSFLILGSSAASASGWMIKLCKWCRFLTMLEEEVYGANSPIWDVEFTQNAGSATNGAAGVTHQIFC